MTPSKQARSPLPSAFLVVALFLPPALSNAAELSGPGGQPDLGRQVLDATGVQGGLVVHLGCGDGRLTAALYADRRYLVQGLDADIENVERAREHLRQCNLDGKVSVDGFDGRNLPYVDDVVNLLVADDLRQVPMDEVMRVLCPRGVAYLREGGRWTKTVKAWPEEIDEWTHYLYNATNNAVADDARVGPPCRVQWKAGPTFARHHDVLASVSAAVAAGGRIFYIIDEAPPSLMSLPPQWRLVARDAFNGVLLWKRPIPSWADYLRPFRSGPPQLARRLVASGDRVYVTLGLDAPVSQLDAATGQTLATYEGTEGTDEILLCDGLLVLVAFEPEAWGQSAADARRGVPSAGSPRRLAVLDAASGKMLWSKSGEETAGLRPCAVAAGGRSVVFQCGQEVRCVELATGKDVWRRQIDRSQPAKNPPKRGGPTEAFDAPTLVLSPAHGVVLLADSGRLVALDLRSGEVLWNAPAAPDFRAPTDLFLADGLVWAGLFAVEGRDPRTGEVRRTLDVEGLITPGHHPRCYRNKATNRYLISGKRGAEFFDLTSDNHVRHNWVRGVCQYGILPANGLLYAPPNACCCYEGALLHGFYALAAGEEGGRARDEGRGVREEGGGIGDGNAELACLQRGPAYGQLVSLPSPLVPRPSSWPTLRGDGARRGRTSEELPTSLGDAWERELGGKLSAPVVADGKVFVASVHLGRVIAMDAADGKTLWTFRAGGRVDTPPTIHRGLALFGAADGWVYCLRASDGELVWRFRAAPNERRIVVDEQLESVWPLHGNVLVHDDVAYAAAGRSCYLDGGLYLYGLDPATGKKLCETRVVVPHDRDETLAFIMAGVRPDVLVTDGKYVYLQQLKFDRQLQRQEGLGRHLLAHSGLADDSWFYRTFWRLGYGDQYDFPNSYIKHDLRVPFGQLLAFDDEVVCGVQTFFSPGIVPGAVVQSSEGSLLFGDANTPLTPDEKTFPESDYPTAVKRPKDPTQHKWTARLPFQARAMLLAGRRLFVAGWPEAAASEDPYAGLQGRLGGRLEIFDAATGEPLGQRKLAAPPVFDGMAASSGRLYISTTTGKVVCLGKGS